ncbi:MAG TPA: anhydro-N-acetylmuramic acid kinase, partial [Limnobacter sp.]|nr:anhydro-N-acetylmuramic acid kinase [Limnobacter sp.]
MSGTSTDGIDVAGLHIDAQNGSLRFLGHRSESFDEDLRRSLLNLQQIPPRFSPDQDPLALMLESRRRLSLAYASAVRGLLGDLGLEAQDVHVLGAHGQTLRHRPDLGYTYQMLDAALLAVETGIDVVADMRSKDVALGGQGAPLVPAFHQAWLLSKGIGDRCAVLNLGGFSNLTVLQGQQGAVLGGDCGPANCLMDWWSQSRFGLDYDDGGNIAASGRLNEPLLIELLQHPFVQRAWPKSTGRDDFNGAWVMDCIARCPSQPSDEDVMTTLMA